MTKRRIILSLLLSIFYSTSAVSFVYFPCSVCPEFDGVNDVIATGKGALKKVRTKADELQEIKDETLGEITSLGEFTDMDTGDSSFQKPEDESSLPGAKTIRKSDLADIHDAQSVANIYETINLQYPVELFEQFPIEQREALIEEYNKKRVEFANDTMMELYVAIRDLEKNRLPAMKEEVEALSACFVEGKDGDSALCESKSSPEDEVGNWTNKYKLEALYDVYLRTLQELTAMKVMYYSATAVQKGLEPFNKDEAHGVEESSDKQSNVMIFEINQKAGFAQMNKVNSLVSGGVMTIEEEKKPAEAKSKAGSNMLVKSTTEFKEKTPFAGAEENLQALPILDGIYNLLNEALSLHNIKQSMPELRKPFLETEKMRALHSVAIGRLVEAEKDASTYFSNYYNDANNLWFGKGCALEYKELGFACPNITGCKTEKEYVPTGKHVILCSDDLFAVTDYVKKRGLSKWAIEAYRESKAKQVLDLNPDDLGSAVMDFDMDTSTPDLDEGVDVANIAGSDELVSESDSEGATDTLREQNLNRWQIGALAAQKIVGADMSSGHSEFSLKEKYPLWNDEKQFYDQYLREKYKNIVLYFKTPKLKKLVYDIASSLTDEITIDENAVNTYKTTRNNQAKRAVNDDCYTVDAAGNTQYNASCADAINKRAKTDIDNYAAKLERELNNAKTNAKASIKEAKAGFEKILNAFEDAVPVEIAEQRIAAEKNDFEEGYAAQEEAYLVKRQEYVDELDNVMNELNGLKKEYNDLMGIKKDAEAEVAAQDDMIALSAKKAAENTETEYVSGIPETAQKTKVEKTAEAEKAFKEAKSKLANLNALQAQADAYRQDIKDIDENLKVLKQQYIKEAVQREQKEIEDMDNAIEGRENAFKLIELVSWVDGTSETESKIFDLSVNIFKTFQERAIEEVNAAYDKIEALGEQKYAYNQYAKIQNIHKQMLDNIKKIKYESAVFDVGNLILTGNVTQGVRDLINAAAFEKDCNQIKCDEADTQYFVSLKSGARDLKAPKPVFAETNPPIREIFHFDATDYDAILKTDAQSRTGLMLGKNPQTTRVEFLKMGRDIPQIWHLILEPKGFVERDVDIKDILHADALVPAGPSVPYGGGPVVMKDLNDDVSAAFLNSKGEKPVKAGAGELAVFLKYDDGLTFRDAVYNLALFFDNQEDSDVDVIRENEKKFLTRNQVGDYLQFMDLEQTYQTRISQLMVKTAEATKTVEDALEKALCTPLRKDTGYVKASEMGERFVSSEFISDDEVYESVLSCLDQGKNMYIAEAVDLMKALPPLNDYLALRKQKLDNMLRVMQIDNEEMVQISDNTEPNGDFEEQVKTKKTDAEVKGRYAKEADKEFERNKSEFEKPYLARYF